MQKDTIKLTTKIPLLRDMLARDIVDGVATGVDGVATGVPEPIRWINASPSPWILSSNSL
jgi:hypothetical protein